MAASISAAELERLVRRINSLDATSRSLRVWLYVWTFAVAAGLIIEYWKEFVHIAQLLWVYALGRVPFEWWRLRKAVAVVIGGILVTVGVLGELKIEFSQSAVETELAEDNGKLTGDLGKLASDARDRVDRVQERAEAVGETLQSTKMEADRLSNQLRELARDVNRQEPRWRLLQAAAPKIIKELIPFAGQRAVVMACGSRYSANVELRRTWDFLFATLWNGAKWKLNIHKDDPPTFWNGCGVTSGIAVFINPTADGRTKRAAEALTAALYSIIPSSMGKGLPVIAGAIRPIPEIGAENPYNLLIGHPELIVVVVAENPDQ